MTAKTNGELAGGFPFSARSGRTGASIFAEKKRHLVGEQSHERRGLDGEKTEDHTEHNPALSKVIERNIRTMIRLRLKADRARSVHDHIADAVSSSSNGVCVCAYCVVRPVDSSEYRSAFDLFPYELLTMIVSLEEISLSSVVLITQNRLSGEIECRADLDLHVADRT